MRSEASRYAMSLVGLGIAVLFGLSDGQPAWAEEVKPPAPTVGKRPIVDQVSEKLEKDSLIVTSEYYIGPEDVLEIIVWRNTDLSKVVTVRPDGRISLPLLGDIEATGLTPGELTANIVSRLKQFKETPTVSVILQQVNSYGIYVLGEVAKPGRYYLKSKTTLLQAITIAGGFTPIAARNKIVIFRWGEGKNNEVKLKASYDDIVLKDHSNQNVVLKPGDTIVVPAETMVLTQ
jgi:polysaccharide export outer membrane protein